MRAAALALLLVAGTLLAGCAQDDPAGGLVACLAPQRAAPDPAWRAQRPQVLVETSLGDLTLALDRERAPDTTAHFLDLVGERFYDDTFAHRVIRGFVVQAGDPNTRDDDPSNDGRGNSGELIADEFNPTLRHDRAGVLSMANSGPDSGSSQFFLTLAAAPHLDDRHTVFGSLSAGNDTLAKLGALRTDAQDRPFELPAFRRFSAIEPLAVEERHEVGVHVVIPEKTIEAGRSVTYAVVVQNNGTTRDQVALGIRAPQGWTCSVDAHPVVPAGTGAVVLATLTPAKGEGTQTIAFEAVSAWNGTASAVATTKATYGTLGAQVETGQRVRAQYAGLLPDGRLFDTSMVEVGQDAGQPKFATVGGWQEKPAYGPFTFVVGEGVIPGFSKLALRARAGETVVARIPWQDAYAQSDEDQYAFPLLQRDLVFELKILS